MKPKLKQKVQFSFTDPISRKVYEGLKRVVGESTASFYKDACKIYSSDAKVESKTHLIGHLLREILGDLTDVLLPVDYKPRGKSKNEKKIKKILRVYKIDPNKEPVPLWLDIAKSKDGVALHRWAHRGGLLSVRPIDEQFKQLWREIQVLFQFLIEVVEKNFANYVDYLDDLLAKEQISKKDLGEFKQKIPCNSVTLGYFFEKLDKPACLKSLIEKGFFDNPMPPFEHPDGGVSFPYWPQMTYLVKMSKIPSAQEDVLSVCLEIKTENLRTNAEILEIAVNLPGSKAVKLVEKSYEKIDQVNSWFHPEKYGRLITHLAKEGQEKEALELARKVLSVKPNPRKPTVIKGHTFSHEPVALFDDWHYEKILKENYPEFVDLVGIKAVIVLLDLIEEFIRLSDEGKESSSKDNYSYIWRRAIEDSSQNFKHEVGDLLITAARDACERYIKSSPKQLGSLIDELDSRKLNIFSRLSLHLLRLFSKNAKEKVVKKLMDKEEFNEGSRLTHEYFLLAENCSGMLNTKQRRQVWDWIMSGADRDIYKKLMKQNGRRVTKKGVERYVKNWQMYHILPFRKLGSKWEQHYQKLEEELGKPEHPSFSSWSSGGSWGPTSGISAEQISKMDPKEIIDFLKKWEPPANDPLDRSREGTGRQLSENVKSDPKRWTKSVSSFGQLDPTYVRSLLNGYRDSLKEGKDFDWNPILGLCKQVLSKPLKIKGRKATSLFGDDPDWSWCRNTIIDLVSEGLREHSGKLPISLKDKTWEIIEELTHDPDPTPKREKEYLKSSQDDPLTLAINSIRGDAMGAAIQYGVWLKKAKEARSQESWTLRKDALELLGVLKYHLDPKKDPSLAIRAIYGEKLATLTWLDKGWVKKNVDVIFPKETKQKIYFNTAWEAYIIFVNPFNDLLRILKGQYKRAIGEVGKHRDAKHHLVSPDQRLAQHLMVFYWRGELDFDDKNGLLNSFFDAAPPDLRGQALEFVGRNLRDVNKVPPAKVKKRLMDLWEKRLTAVKKAAQKYPDSKKELAGFGWWFASRHLDDEWLLRQLKEVLELGCELQGDHLIVEKMVELASSYPLEVISSTTMLTEQDKKGWGVLTWKEELREVVRLVLATKRREPVKLARELVNKLIAKNHLEFKDLIETK